MKDIIFDCIKKTSDVMYVSKKYRMTITRAITITILL